MAWPGPDDPGYVNVHYTFREHHGVGGRAFRDPHELMQYVQAITLSPHIKDIYFCLSTQRLTETDPKSGKVKAVRNAPNALNTKALWLDVDVKPEKGYGNLKEALDAIFKFCADNKLPPPSAIIYSGGGVHVYWISDRALSIADWAPYAAGLRELAIRSGLKCDAGLTTDAARVLRIPGTFNRKEATPRPVVLKHLGASYDFSVVFAALAALGASKVTAAVTAPSRSAFDLSAFAGYKVPPELAALDPRETLSAGIEKRSDLPLKIEPLMQCPHFQEAVNTGGAGYSQGLWMLDVLSASFTEGGLPLAHAMSKGYAAYDKGATDALYDRKVADREARNIGWPGCHSFEAEGCKLCATCVYKGKIGSPLNLTSRVDPPPADVLPPPMVADKLAEPDEDEYDLNLPSGYQLNDDGIICKRVELDPEDDGEKDKDPLLKLFHFRIGSPMLAGGVAPAMHLKVEYGKDGLLDLVIPQAAFSNDMDLRKAMDSHFGLIYTPNEKHVRHFMKSWQAQMIEANARVNAQPFGWLMSQEGGDEPLGFCYGGKTFFADGTEGPAGIADLEIKEGFTPRGNTDAWFKLLKVVTEQHHPALEVLLLASFAAPLMFIGGEKAGVLWAWSHDSAAHKSTSIETGVAAWANPTRGKLKASSSTLGITFRLGVLQNLPVIVDEVRHTSQVEVIAKLTGELTEGGDGVKMKRSGTEQRKSLTWETLMLVGANQDCRNVILADDPTTDAGLRRVFVFEVDKRGDTTSEPVSLLRSSLNNNFGRIGTQFAKYIAMHRQNIADEGATFVEELKQKVNFQSEERFWLSMCAAILEAAEVLNAMLEKEWFHTQEIFDFLAHHYQEQRNYATNNCAIGGSSGSAFNSLNQFFNSTLDYQLWTTNMQMGRGKQAVTMLHMSPAALRGEKVTWVHWVRDQRLVHISKKALDEWCRRQQPAVSTDTLWKSIKGHYNAKLVDKVQLTAGLRDHGQAREPVVEILVPAGSPWEPNLLAYSEVEEVPVDPAPVSTEVADALLGQATAQAAADLALVKATSD